MNCENCKWSKTKSQVARDGTIMMDRFCYFHVPQVQLIPQQGGVGQISYRPKVEDDDYCSEFSPKQTTEKELNDVFKPADSSPAIVIDLN
jgi:hypothetical protein